MNKTTLIYIILFGLLRVLKADNDDSEDCSEDCSDDSTSGNDDDDYKDRGDGVSVLVIVLNWIFVVLVTAIWLRRSRFNSAKYVNINSPNEVVSSP